MNMTTAPKFSPPSHPLTEIIQRLQAGGALLPDSPENVIEVVGILKSYGVVLDAYWRNLTYISEHQFLELFPFFKYFNGDVSFNKLLKHWGHDRLNYEFAEYCMKAMMYHGGGKLDAYLDTPEFDERAQQAIAAKLGQIFDAGACQHLFWFLARTNQAISLLQRLRTVLEGDERHVSQLVRSL